jgi:hypothetical protein
MKRATKNLLIAAAAAGALLSAGGANASLNVFHVFTGTLGISTGGFGSTSDAGSITANAPAGSTVVAAYLYSSLFSSTTAAGTLNGNALSYSPLGVNNGFLQASRADVTSIVAPVINGGPGGAYSFNIQETSGNTDGEALVVVYSNGTLATSTIGILDGFSASTGDNSSINFAAGLDPTAAGFHAELRIGDGFSCDMTNVAGDNDDSVDANPGNGNLITVGSDNDPFTAASPGSPQSNYLLDHERYNLSPFITKGDTSIKLHTLNPSNDDNIFLEVFSVSGVGVVHGNGGVPEPATWAMMLMGFFGLGAMMRRRRDATIAA